MRFTQNIVAILVGFVATAGVVTVLINWSGYTLGLPPSSPKNMLLVGAHLVGAMAGGVVTSWISQAKTLKVSAAFATLLALAGFIRLFLMTQATIFHIVFTLLYLPMALVGGKLGMGANRQGLDSSDDAS